MKDLIPTIKITNYAGVSSIKDGMKSNAYSKVEREKKPSWIRMTANQVNQNYRSISILFHLAYEEIALPSN